MIIQPRHSDQVLICDDEKKICVWVVIAKWMGDEKVVEIVNAGTGHLSSQVEGDKVTLYKERKEQCKAV